MQGKQHPQERFRTALAAGHTRNARLIVLDGMFFGCGFAAFTPFTILPAFLKHSTDNPIVINSVVALFMLGLFGISFVSCWLYDGRTAKSGAMLTWSLVQRSMMVLLAPIALFSSHLGHWAVPLFLLVYGASNVAWGMSAILWQELLGRWLTDERRSVVVGVRFLGEQSMTIVCGLLFLVVLDTLTFPLSYAVIFLAGALFWWGCHTTLCFTREAPYPVANPRQSFTGFLRGLGEIVRGDAAFRSFIVFLLLASGNAVSGALYTAYPLDRFMGEAGGEARDFYAGICNVVIGVSFALGALAAGHVSRLLGERKGLAASVVFSLCAPAAALLAPSRTVYFVTFVFHGLSMGFLIVCLMSILLLFSSVEDRLRYIAIGSTVRGVGSAVYSTAGGIVASVWDPRYAFALTMVFMAAALGVLLTRLREAGRS